MSDKCDCEQRHEWKSTVAGGLCFMFIAFGFGGCVMMIELGEAQKVAARVQPK
jgi:hypothetical protein